MIVRSVVVLPAPFRPTRHTTSRSRTSRETRRRIWLAWMNTSTLWTDSTSGTNPHRHFLPHPALIVTAASPHVPLTLPSPPPGARGKLSLSPQGRGQVEGGVRSPAPPPHHHVHHLRVRLDLRRRGVGQHLALVQRDDAVRVAEHDVHVVLDLDDGAEPHAPGGAHEDLHHRMLVRRGHPARGLVEQDDLRLEGERRGHVEKLLVALRQLARGRVSFFVEIEDRGDLQRFFLDAAISCQRGEE